MRYFICALLLFIVSGYLIVAHFSGEPASPRNAPDIAPTKPIPHQPGAPARGTSPQSSEPPGVTARARHEASTGDKSALPETTPQRPSEVRDEKYEKPTRSVHASAAVPTSAAELLADMIADVPESEKLKPAFVPSLAKQMHKSFSGDPRDDAWASHAEDRLKQYFGEVVGALAGQFEFLLVECHTNLCEIQTASRFLDQGDKDADYWNKIIYGMKQEAWWAECEFREPAMQMQIAPDGRRILFVTYLIRNQPAGG